MSLRTTSTTRPCTVIWCFSVLILILHEFKNLIRQSLFVQDLLDRIADFSLLDPVATPSILFRVLDCSIQVNGELLIISKIIIERPLGTSIQRFGIGCPAGRVLHLPGEFNNSRQVLLIFLCLMLTLLDQEIEEFRHLFVVRWVGWTLVNDHL